MIESIAMSVWPWISWAWLAFWGPTFGPAVLFGLGVLAVAALCLAALAF